jgi:hypothetical protein
MTRARWITGALIGVGALAVAGDALASYLAERLIVGVVAVLGLAGVLAIGFASLTRAQRYVARELASLGAEPPGGSLVQARREKLLALQRRGVTPDLDVLADATAAEEAGRGYTGKYLVATTVLIGLVGTFGGLMETMARVGPLLKSDLGAGGAAGVLGLVAAPLAGLHVTFGTSVVAILVTLSLALIQGDVTLHHERMLAALQERTRHVLVPELWPAGESAPERTVQRLQELRLFLEEALTGGAAASAEKVAAVVRVEVKRLVEQIGTETRAASAAQTAALQSAATTTSLRQTAEIATRELREAAAASRDSLTTIAAQSHDALAAAATKIQAALAAAADRSHDTIGAAAAQSHEAIALAAARSHETITAAAVSSQETMTAAATSSREATAAASAASLEVTAASATALRDAVTAAATASGTALDQAALAARELTAAAVEALVAASTTSAEALVAASTRSSEAFVGASTRSLEALALVGVRSSEAFAAASSRSSEAFAVSTTAAIEALGNLRASLNAELEGSSTALAAAATSLQGSVEALSPALVELAPQLGALTAEVALLAARADSPEQANAVLDELVRLGEDVERLVASSPSPPPSPLPEVES